MNNKGKDKPVLKKGKNYVKFHRLLAKAEASGRLDGKFQCPVCGMHFNTSVEAEGCCRIDAD